MRIGRTLPPAAAPLSWRDLSAGLKGALRGSRETQRFAEELRSHFNRRHCFLVSSGKTALALILLALKEARPDRDRVLIPAFTCYSVPSAIVRAGLKVSLCDIDPDTLDFDEQQLRANLTDPTPAVCRYRSTCSGCRPMWRGSGR
jgi:perosamine synthetase